MAAQSFANKTIWITGASYGIGEAVAREFAAQGANLVLSARSEDKLNALRDDLTGNANGEFMSAPLDVTDLDANKNVVKDILKTFGKIDIALFNAGTAEYVDIDNFDSGVFERMMEINFMSIVRGIEAVLPALRESRGQLVGMSSTVAYQGLPRGQAYSASKAAIRNMLQGLRIELQRENISVSVICPGFVKTPLTDKNDFPMPLMIEADKAASIIVEGIRRRKAEIHFPKQFSIPLKLISSLPQGLTSRILAGTAKAS